MKTKLLKKYRREAKNFWWVEKWSWKDSNCIYVVRNLYNNSKDFIADFINENSAMEFCRYKRIDYILYKVRKEKVRLGKYIVI